MLNLFNSYVVLFRSVNIIVNESIGSSHVFKVSAYLHDGSRLEIHDSIDFKEKHKYAYQWMNADNSLRRRWDNSPHWHDIPTFPHHVHIAEETDERRESSNITSLEKLLQFLQGWFNNNFS